MGWKKFQVTARLTMDVVTWAEDHNDAIEKSKIWLRSALPIYTPDVIGCSWDSADVKEAPEYLPPYAEQEKF